MKYTPHDYQKKAIKFGVAQSFGGLFLDPGLGKTSISYSIANLLRRQKLVERVLVIAPLRVAHSAWPNEREKWDNFADLRVSVLHGPKKDALLLEPHDISVINPEGLEWLFAAMKKLPKKKRFWWDMLIVDESTRFKHTTTKRFKALRPVLPKFKRRYILTGTPSPNGMMDLFGQMYIVDLGKSLGKFISHYRMKYFDQTGFGGFTWTLRAGAEEAITEAIRPYVLRMSGADYLELPPLIENTITVELPEKARKVYDEMEELLVTQIRDEAVVAPNTASAAGKCRQIANGGLYLMGDDEVTVGKKKRKSEHLHDAKTEALISLIEELSGKPAFIAYEFQHDMERLKVALAPYCDGPVPHLGGGTTTAQQRDIELKWNRGELPILLAQPASVAHGLNMQEVGAAVIWYGLTWDLELYEQFNRRIWRQGQKERVVVTRIVAKNTIDQAVLGALKSKGKRQTALLDALKGDLATRHR
jgi:SNF2 family DNA or RNA helicase